MDGNNTCCGRTRKVWRFDKMASNCPLQRHTTGAEISRVLQKTYSLRTLIEIYSSGARAGLFKRSRNLPHQTLQNNVGNDVANAAQWKRSSTRRQSFTRTEANQIQKRARRIGEKNEEALRSHQRPRRG